MVNAFDMDSEELLRRGQMAMYIKEDFLSVDNDKHHAEDDVEHFDAKGDQKSTSFELEDPEDGQTDGERGENTPNGLWKRLKSLMCPCCSKLHWRLSSGDAAKIKHLREENKRLKKLAVKFLDEYEQLKTRIGELSEVEHKLTAALSNCDELRAELQELQRSRDGLHAQMSKQSDEHRDEVKRLDAELKNAREVVAKLARDKQTIEAKNAKNEQSLRAMENALQTLTISRDALKS